MPAYMLPSTRDTVASRQPGPADIHDRGRGDWREELRQLLAELPITAQPGQAAMDSSLLPRPDTPSLPEKSDPQRGLSRQPAPFRELAVLAWQELACYRALAAEVRILRDGLQVTPLPDDRQAAIELVSARGLAAELAERFDHHEHEWAHQFDETLLRRLLGEVEIPASPLPACPKSDGPEMPAPERPGFSRDGRVENVAPGGMRETAGVLAARAALAHARRSGRSRAASRRDRLGAIDLAGLPAELRGRVVEAARRAACDEARDRGLGIVRCLPRDGGWVFLAPREDGRAILLGFVGPVTTAWRRPGKALDGALLAHCSARPGHGR